MNRLVFQAALLLMGSGFCALVYQTVWFRLLRLVFGGTTAATSAVLAIFMAGMGLGSWILGSRVERSPNPLRLYAKLEAGIAVSAAVTPMLVVGVGAVYTSMGGSQTLGGPLSTLLRLLLSALALGLPAFLMGGTLPAMARAVETDEDVARGGVSALYGMNTLGAVAGVLITTFITIELWGSRSTLWAAAAFNLLVAGAAFALARDLDREPEDVPTERGHPPDPYVLGASAAVGFAFLLMELVWYRMLAPILGGSTYTFGLILGVALLGIGAGGLLYSATAKRSPTWSLLGATCGLEALLLGLPYAAGDSIAIWAILMWPSAEQSFLALTLGWFALTFAVVFPASLMAGYQFPLIVALAGQGDEDIGRDVGYVYAFNTLGAITGSLAGGFGLMPFFGAPTLWRLTTVLLALLAVSAVVYELMRTLDAYPVRITVAVGAAVLALITWSAEGPTPVWRHSGVGVRTIDAPVGPPNEAQERLNELRRQTAWERDGIEASIAVNTGHGLALIVNGKSDGHSRMDGPTQILAGLIAGARHPSPKRVLVIGLGTGATVGWLAAMEEVESVEVIEIEPAIVEVARMSRSTNHAALESPKVHLIYGDAREVILASDRRWDLIISEPSNPYRIGVAALFTQDFYRVVQSRLEPGGVFAQWLQAYDVDAVTVRTAFATLGSVFPYIETWELTSAADLLFVATPQPLPHDRERIEKLVSQGPLEEALRRIDGVAGVEGLYAAFLANPELTRALANAHRGPLHTDDRPVFEFGMARAARSSELQLQHLRMLSRSRGTHRPPGIELDGTLVDELIRLRFLAHGIRVPPQPPEGSAPEPRFRALARIAYQRGKVTRARQYWERQQSAPLGPIDMVMLGEAYGRTADARVLPVIERLRALDMPVESDVVAAVYHHSNEDPDQAAAALSSALKGYRVDALPSPSLMKRALMLAALISQRTPRHAPLLLDAVSTPFAAYGVEEDRRQTQVNIARQVPEKCAVAWGNYEPYPPWRLKELQARSDCYSRTRHPLADVAARDVATYLSQRQVTLSDGL